MRNCAHPGDVIPMTGPSVKRDTNSQGPFCIPVRFGPGTHQVLSFPLVTSFVLLTNTRSKAEAGNLCTVLVKPSKNRTNSASPQIEVAM